MKRVLRHFAFGLISFLIVAAIALWINAHQLHSPPIWNGITPGVSTRQDVIDTLGVPDEIGKRRRHLIYSYNQPELLSWETVEIWIQLADQKEVVRGIFLIFPVDFPSPANNLGEFTGEYGSPNMISWTLASYFRFLGWTKSGVAAHVWVGSVYDLKSKGDINELSVNRVFLFEPMTRVEFDDTRWPWPKSFVLAPSNMYTEDRTDAPDILPLNPFGWLIVP